ncbi:MAG: AmmeMemoRadiSam system protein A [Desulfovibrio sp.]|jgi:AmmeMemoRadiSam system protein A|nr:AmmeMemoRadiSam system protein A [Desulfovibrio sp.]
MPFIWAALMPHPPVLLPEVGRGREKEAGPSLDGARRLCARLAALNAENPPEALLVLSPHAPHAAGGLFLNSAENVRGSMARFGAPATGVSFQSPAGILDEIIDVLQKAGLPYTRREMPDITQDHGSIVPLRFLAPTFPEGKLPPVIEAGPSGLRQEQALALGDALRELSGKRRWALLASGDLSHRLKADGPYGFNPAGPVFDAAVVEALKAGDPSPLSSLGQKTVADAGECGLRPVLCLLRLARAPVEVFSYEGPFGIGYCNALWVGDKGESLSKAASSSAKAAAASPATQAAKPRMTFKINPPEKSAHKPDKEKKSSPASGARVSVPKVSGAKVSAPKVSVARVSVPKVSVQDASAPKVSVQDASVPEASVPNAFEHPYARLARTVITSLLTGKGVPGAEMLRALSSNPEIWSDRKGCFVSIKTKTGALRGCIGTFLPTQPSLQQEIMANAVSASVRDPRFPPMRADELDNVRISVDVLEAPEVVEEGMKLDPKAYGVIVSKEGRRGLLLPDLAGVDTVEKQLLIAAQKAGIRDLQGARIERFRVRRYFEDSPEAGKR